MHPRQEGRIRERPYKIPATRQTLMWQTNATKWERDLVYLSASLGSKRTRKAQTPTHPPAYPPRYANNISFDIKGGLMHLYRVPPWRHFQTAHIISSEIEGSHFGGFTREAQKGKSLSQQWAVPGKCTAPGRFDVLPWM